VSERTIDLSILMPVYDERATVERAIEAMLETELGASYELIVVDDGSRDGTRELLDDPTWPEHMHLLSTIAIAARRRRSARASPVPVGGSRRSSTRSRCALRVVKTLVRCRFL